MVITATAELRAWASLELGVVDHYYLYRRSLWPFRLPKPFQCARDAEKEDCKLVHESGKEFHCCPSAPCARCDGCSSRLPCFLQKSGLNYAHGCECRSFHICTVTNVPSKWLWCLLWAFDLPLPDYFWRGQQAMETSEGCFNKQKFHLNFSVIVAWDGFSIIVYCHSKRSRFFTPHNFYQNWMTCCCRMPFWTRRSSSLTTLSVYADFLHDYYLCQQWLGYVILLLQTRWTWFWSLEGWLAFTGENFVGLLRGSILWCCVMTLPHQQFNSSALRPNLLWWWCDYYSPCILNFLLRFEFFFQGTLKSKSDNLAQVESHAIPLKPWFWYLLGLCHGQSNRFPAQCCVWWWTK